MSFANPWLHVRLLGVTSILSWLVYVASGREGIENLVWVAFGALCFVYGWTLIILTEVEQMVFEEVDDHDESQRCTDRDCRVCARR